MCEQLQLHLCLAAGDFTTVQEKFDFVTEAAAQVLERASYAACFASTCLRSEF